MVHGSKFCNSGIPSHYSVPYRTELYISCQIDLWKNCWIRCGDQYSLLYVLYTSAVCSLLPARSWGSCTVRSCKGLPRLSSVFSGTKELCRSFWNRELDLSEDRDGSVFESVPMAEPAARRQPWRRRPAHWCPKEAWECSTDGRRPVPMGMEMKWNCTDSGDQDKPHLG